MIGLAAQAVHPWYQAGWLSHESDKIARRVLKTLAKQVMIASLDPLIFPSLS